MCASDEPTHPPEPAHRVDLLRGAVPARERADAARNRQRVLSAAAELFASGDPREVTMERIARAAGVGRATLYRRYPDVSSIATALLDEHERALQGQLLSGEPPLGPGAAPADRLAAFFTAMVELLERFGFLLLAAETGPARYVTGAYRFWHVHVTTLLADAGVEEPGARADLLLSAVDPELYRHQRERLTPEQITADLHWLARQTLTPGSAAPSRPRRANGEDT